ncbi:amidase domain-containing protein [Clostridium thailandense]|uniref:amidase domain-containing protein n=1 Tax=Clostridium thailandense TaxID=2794346 RepID=UPI001FE6F9DE|nr:amidase domain-containing protein [Clostridium thailandense]
MYLKLNFKKRFIIYIIVILVINIGFFILHKNPSVSKLDQLNTSEKSVPSISKNYSLTQDESKNLKHKDLLRFIFSSPYDENELKTAIEDIYNRRSSAFVTGDLLSLKPYFDTSQKFGVWALEHEVKRVKYLHDWSKERGMKFTNVQSTVRIKKIHPNTKLIKIALEESYKFDYNYPQDEVPITNSFGVGIRHVLSLVKKDDKWMVYNDWYTDCFEDALQAYTGDIKENLSPPSGTAIKRAGYIPTLLQKQTYKKSYYNREKAVEYADKYCGAAWGSGNNFKYNKKYKDFNGAGGDCTNFASQVLGDKEGGELPTDYTWYCSYSRFGNSQGSTAWVNADGLKDYLIYSGKGSVIKKGTFKDLASPLPDLPNGILGKLQLADLVCYEKKSNIDHFGIVTGFDSHGYPLINSHTTDRYHVPWDLGWGDNKIKFFLIHING